MKIELLDGTTEYPLQKCGYNAGVCWDAPLNDKDKNIKRAISCIKAGHGRVLEYVDIELVIDEVSARCLRELYTHIGGAPTRLQSSTRYVSEQDGFGYYTPPKIENNIANKTIFTEGMADIQKAYNGLLENGVTKEDAANLLPLGMDSKMVWKINLRALINFENKRLCSRALLEIRQLATEIKKQLAAKNEEWAWIADNLFVPTCEIYKYRNPQLVFCPEQQCCGKHKKIEDLKIGE
jgi:thymidylate synthase (FAD)